ncbi:choice-of-anchor J domain-containing protein [Myroides guanonis]|uniref:Gliding motility-associated C-terminal domain-containing protein n=1 Tax=Myroides guanonis TaxID=1150112 RepID=A0A1I3SQ39_9FLAO|nr:choice-of-anchor J domain-containing protein [Myroides guanonis]SFJ59741.1 gliding motility-associated C-terminal domain-containing protein [Myroides guanonis]
MMKNKYTFILLFVMALAYSFQQLEVYSFSRHLGNEWILEQLYKANMVNTCTPPNIKEITYKNLEKDKVTFVWNDPANSSWQYHVQLAAGGTKPTGSGTIVKTNSITITNVSGVGGGSLMPNVEYEFWLSTYCEGSSTTEWIGPIHFKTLCDVQPLPYWEGFNATSSTLGCWTVIDKNNKSIAPSNTSKIWRVNNSFDTAPYEGNQYLIFIGGVAAGPFNDFLVSPSFQLDDTKYYRLKYNFITSVAYKSSFNVVLSEEGIEPKDFKKILLYKKDHLNNGGVWNEEKIVIGKTKGEVNIGWHIKNEIASPVSLGIDNLFLEEIACPEPVQLGVKDVKSDGATIFWSDDFGSKWEYAVQKSGGAPPASGIVSNNKEVVISKENNGSLLDTNTEYEFYARTNCGNGLLGEWSGPFKFRTSCAVLKTPLWEGFNPDSKTIYCWTIIDGNQDAISPTSNNIWKAHSISYEGISGMWFNGTARVGGQLQDDWLVSPTMLFEKNKTYRLKYHYKTGAVASYDYEFEVLLSKAGVNVDKFSTIVVPKEKYKYGSDWIEEIVFISGVDGDVNIAWRITSATATQLSIDNVFIEEVMDCAEPIKLGVKDLEKDEATIYWEDDFGAKGWEYYVQKTGGKVPATAGVVANKKENIVSKEFNGDSLEPNTDYEFYVRTDCANGKKSIWQGPFRFTTSCSVYDIPFEEGFEESVKTYRCWTIVDGNGDSTSPTGSYIWRTYTSGVKTGKQCMYFYGAAGKQNDDWLISPTFKMEAEDYVLKYYYKTSAIASQNSSFEILLSSNGTNVVDFNTTLLPTKIYKEANWKEGVVFFKGVPGDVNLAWHVNAMSSCYVYLDDVSLKKVENCPEPYYVTVTGTTSTSINIEWQQNGGVDEWEVIVVDYGKDETSIPLKTTVVTGTPKTSITGLNPGVPYTIYVRGKCSDKLTKSDWSTPLNTATSVAGNDECSGAINIPVNTTLECVKTVSGTLNGATSSANPKSSCNNGYAGKTDAWFEFTALASSHKLELMDFGSISGSSVPSIYAEIYDQPCVSMTNSLGCYGSFSQSASNYWMLRDLVPGKKYYVRFGSSTAFSDYLFNVCITTASGDLAIKVSPNNEKYNEEELVKSVLIKSECNLVSNVQYKVGDGSAATKTMNTLGYFSKENSIFPFEEGIVLSTNEVEFVPGPFRGQFSERGTNNFRWGGDDDLKEAINDAGGHPMAYSPNPVMRVTQLEFDFIPIKDSIQFDYLFASNSYASGCSYACSNAALFAAWLVDTKTGRGQNLAKVEGTETAVAVNTIRDAKKSGISCDSRNEEYYWKHYDKGVDNPLEAPIDFIGFTEAMKSKTIAVIPGRKYHIKLAVMDFCPVVAHSSAVFFKGGSFDIGNLDLGADLLIDTNNALCEGDSVIIESGIVLSDELKTEIEWYKDGVIVPGATDSNLVVTDSGEYKVLVRFAELECESSGTILVEMYPSISKMVHSADDIVICRQSLNDIIVDLTMVEENMFKDVERSDYEVEYYKSQADADLAENKIEDSKKYSFGKRPESTSLYMLILNKKTGCSELFTIPIIVSPGDLPGKINDVAVCGEYIFPTANGDYFTQAGGMGEKYKEGDVLTNVGENSIYFLQLNNEEGCFEETKFTVTITAKIIADNFEDRTLKCELYELKPLSDFNRYYTEPNGKGDELFPGRKIEKPRTIYVYARSEDGLCVDESSFSIDYEDCPIQKGISPNGDGLNDNFDLSGHGVMSLKIYNRYGVEVYTFGYGYTDQWNGQDRNGNVLPDGTYYYIVIANNKERTGWVQVNK